MAVLKEKKTLLEMIPEINKSIEYLQACDDFSTAEVFQHFRRITAASDTCLCDDLTAFRKYLGSSTIGSLFPKIWNALSIYLDGNKWESQGFRNLKKMLLAFGNIADSSRDLSITLGKCGGISLLLAGLKQMSDLYEKKPDDSNKRDYVTLYMFGLLHNAIRLCPSNLSVYRQNNAVSILKGFLELDNLWQVFALLVLAYIETDIEKKELASTEVGVRVLIDLLKEAVDSDDHVANIGPWCFSVFELLDGINHLAINDDVKTAIENNEAISFIIQMLQEDFSPEEQQVAAEALWNLAFVNSLRKSNLLQGAIQTLKKLTKSNNKELRGACASALFEIQGDVSIESDSSPSEAISEPESFSINQSAQKQIMLSYQWDSQDLVVQIRDSLVASGYKVWMDVTNIRGDILGAMADAVQKSDVILLCMTEKYKDSKSCRTEASYAYKLKKTVIPLLLQEGYEPDGWLGILQGMDLYYKCFSYYQINTNMGELLKAVDGEDEVDGPIQPLQQESLTSQMPVLAANWSKDEVQMWLKDNNLSELCKIFKKFNGSHLQNVHSRLRNNEGKVHDELKSDYALTFADRTVFIVALNLAFKQ